MHLFIPWWAFALSPLLIAIIIAGAWTDVISPTLKLGAIFIGFAVTFGVLVGHFI